MFHDNHTSFFLLCLTISRHQAHPGPAALHWSSCPTVSISILSQRGQIKLSFAGEFFIIYLRAFREYCECKKKKRKEKKSQMKYTVYSLNKHEMVQCNLLLWRWTRHVNMRAWPSSSSHYQQQQPLIHFFSLFSFQGEARSIQNVGLNQWKYMWRWSKYLDEKGRNLQGLHKFFILSSCTMTIKIYLIFPTFLVM